MTIKVQPETIFGRAIEIATTQERAAFLEQACQNDTVLRQQVEKLVGDYFRAGDFLEQPLAQIEPPTAIDPSTRDLVGTQIGPYKLREQIGEGGMGVVYVAQQTEPVRRKVALKVIRPGMASKDVVGRFAAERQSLALMNHPNIAQVFDGGTTAAGQPYFVMELVQGLPITEYCDHQRLSTDQRLKLFGTVCKAVQHAHQRGIIHRDLKPSNIIVAEIDADSVPKVIDFGVAKSINQQLINETVYTQFSQMVGTPLYMSPEQAGLGVIDIDTRSDVYSLGVLLYELLSGSTPFDGESLRSVGFDEMRRIIREDNPPRPSAMVSTLNAEALSTVADFRRIDTRKFSDSLSGELDWLVMKALEKDRDRRYESASEMGADIERYLEGDAVQACPPSTMYRLKKYATRHKGWLTTAVLLVATLLVATGVSVSYAIKANREKTRADAETKIAAAVNAFLHDDLLAQASPNNQPDPNVTLLEVVDRAAKTIADRFADQPLVEAAIRRTLAKTYRALGKYTEAVKHADRALQLHSVHLGDDATDTIETALLSGAMLRYQGKYLASRERLAELSPRAQRVLGPTSSLTLEIQQNLAHVIHDQGDYGEAERITQKVLKARRLALGDEHPETCRSMLQLGHTYNAQVQFDKAEEMFSRTIEILGRTLGEEHPRVLASMGSLAMVYSNQSRHKEAENLQRKVLDTKRRVLGDEHPETLKSIGNLANVFVQQDRLDESEQLYQEILEISLRTLGKEHPDTLRGQSNLAVIYQRQEKSFEAEQLYIETLNTLRARLGDEHPLTLNTQVGLASVYLKQNQFDEAEELGRPATDILRRTLGDEHPHTLAGIGLLTEVYALQGKYEDAERLLRELIRSQRGVLGNKHPDTLQSIGNLNYSIAKQGRYSEAEKPLKELMAIEQGLGLEDTNTMFNLAWVIEHQKRYSEAESLYRKVLNHQQATLGNQHSETLETMRCLAHMYELQNYDKAEESEDLCQLRLDILRTTKGDEHVDTLEAMYFLAHFYGAQGRYKEAEDLVRQVLKVRSSKLAGDPTEANNALDLNRQGFLSFVVQKQGRYDEAATLWQELIKEAHGTWGETHFSLIQAKNNLEHTFQQLERYEELEMLLRERSINMIRTRGVEDFDTQETLLKLGKCWPRLLQGARKRGEVDQLFRRANEFVERVSDEGHDVQSLMGACVPLYNAINLVEGEVTIAEEEFRRIVADHLATALESARLAVQDDPKSIEQWYRLSEFAPAYYRTQSWVGAEVEARLAVKLAADNPDVMRVVVPLFLLAGKQDEYGELCERLLHDSQRWSGSNVAHVVAICSLNPLPPTNPETLLKVAQKAVDGGQDSSIHSQRRVYYRVSEYAKAIEGLTSMESPDQAQMFDLAIAHHLAGHAEEARAWWEKASGSLENWDTESATARMEVEVLRQEAERLIFGKKGSNKEHEETAANRVDDT